MNDIIPYSDIFSLNTATSISEYLSKYASNPLLVPIKAKLIDGVFGGLKKIIDTNTFKKKMEKDMQFSSMFTTLMMEIDDNPDQTTRLSKLRKLLDFYTKDCDQSKIETYEIFQIARKLKSFEFIVLSVAYKIFKMGREDHLSNKNIDNWRQIVSESINNSESTRALISSAEPVLVENRLLLPGNSLNEYHSRMFRLTDLGIRLCELLEDGEE